LAIVSTPGFALVAGHETVDVQGRTRQDVLRSKVLVVDDDMITCEILMEYLNEAGFENIGFAFDGEMALEKIADTAPDLVVLDIDMPVMDGFAVLSAIRSKPEFQDLPVIVQSALDTREERMRILKAGATIHVVKPVDKDLLVSRVYNQIERMTVMRRLEAYQERVAEELAAARRMQLQLLPDEADVAVIEQSGAVRIDWHFQPSSEIGGDWMDIFRLDGGRFGVCLADFTGHGVGAAINTFRLQSTIKANPIGNRSPGEYLSLLNDQLVQMLPRGQFATMLLAIFTPEDGRIDYAAAGAPSPLFGSSGPDGSFAFADASGLPLGISTKATYDDRSIPFNPGDRIIFYSDVLIEQEGGRTPPLEESGLMTLFSRIEAESDSASALEALVAEFYRRYGGVMGDDMSIVRVERLG
jgi:sigma-B regulation protein RsbU (phosphoserine phosphatase)